MTASVKDLAQIGIALSAEQNLSKLLEMIVDEARDFTDADGGTLYILDKEQQHLQFKILPNQSMKLRKGGTSGVETNSLPVPLQVDGKPNHTNVSSHVALTKQIVNIDNIYNAKGFDFSGAKSYDAANGYRTKSMLVVPMKNHESEVNLD